MKTSYLFEPKESVWAKESFRSPINLKQNRKRKQKWETPTRPCCVASVEERRRSTWIKRIKMPIPVCLYRPAVHLKSWARSDKTAEHQQKKLDRTRVAIPTENVTKLQLNSAYPNALRTTTTLQYFQLFSQWRNFHSILLSTLTKSICKCKLRSLKWE